MLNNNNESGVGKSKQGLVFIIAFLLVGGFVLYQQLNKPKFGFIVIQEVFSEFSLKKDYEKKFSTIKNARIRILDSLQLELKFVANKLDQQKEKDQNDIINFNNKRDVFIQRKQQFENDNTLLSQQYDQEILTQLNQYVKDYGEKNNYAYIFGNDNNGSLMYAKEADNITKPVIEYINARYKGFGK